MARPAMSRSDVRIQYRIFHYLHMTGPTLAANVGVHLLRRLVRPRTLFYDMAPQSGATRCSAAWALFGVALGEPPIPALEVDPPPRLAWLPPVGVHLEERAGPGVGLDEEVAESDHPRFHVFA